MTRRAEARLVAHGVGKERLDGDVRSDAAGNPGKPPSRPDRVSREAGGHRRIPTLLRRSWWRGRIEDLTAWQRAFHARVETRFPVVTALQASPP